MTNDKEYKGSAGPAVKCDKCKTWHLLRHPCLPVAEEKHICCIHCVGIQGHAPHSNGCEAPQPTNDFSKFFRTASPEEKAKVFEDVAKKANEDQRKILTQKEWLTQPTSDWAEQRGNLLANFALGYPPIDILDSAYLAGLDSSKDKISQAKEEGRREERYLKDILIRTIKELERDEARLATITLFEEEIRYRKEDWGCGKHKCDGSCTILTDLLAYADSLKKK